MVQFFAAQLNLKYSIMSMGMGALAIVIHQTMAIAKVQSFNDVMLHVPVSRLRNIMMFVASATALSSRSNDDAMSCASRRRSDKEIDAVPPPPLGLMGVAGDLCVARRRRCPGISSSSLLDLPSQDPQTSWYSWDETLKHRD